MDAASFWARRVTSKKSNGSAADDLVAMGAPAEVIAMAREQDPDEFEVWEDNWEALTVFLRLTTQWNRMDGAFLGLNYTSVDFIFKILDVKDPKSVFDDLQVMELSALQVLNSRE